MLTYLQTLQEGEALTLT